MVRTRGHDYAGSGLRTECDLAACGGDRDKLVEQLQEIYDISSNEAEGAVAYYEYQLALWDDNHRTRAIV